MNSKVTALAAALMMTLAPAAYAVDYQVETVA